MTSERPPEDVETVVLEPRQQVGRAEESTVPFAGTETLQDSQFAAEESSGEGGVAAAVGMPQEDGTLRDIEFKDYEELYKKWRASEIGEGDVRRAGGPGLLDLMLAQLVLDEETQQNDDLPGPGLPDLHEGLEQDKAKGQGDAQE